MLRTNAAGATPSFLDSKPPNALTSELGDLIFMIVLSVAVSDRQFSSHGEAPSGPRGLVSHSLQYVATSVPLRRRALLAALPAMVLARAAWAAEPVLRVGDQKGGAQSVMKAAGALNDLPYRLEWSQFPAAAPVLEALNADAVDVSLAGDAPTTFALAAGLRAHIIAPVRTSGAGTAIMVPKDSPIRTVADLKGRSIAVNRGSIGHALVLQLAAAQRWSASDYTLVNLLPAEARTALSSGAVDVLVLLGRLRRTGTVDGWRPRDCRWTRRPDDRLVLRCGQRYRYRQQTRRAAGFLPQAGRRTALGVDPQA